MNDTTPIEKKSLEAHVDLCAERYKLMSHQIVTVNSKVDAPSAFWGGGSHPHMTL